MRYVAMLLGAVALAGCQQRLEANERADHASCVKILTERGQSPNDVAAYNGCRANLNSYRRDRAIADID